MSQQSALHELVLQLSDHACAGCWEDIARVLQLSIPEIKRQVEALQNARRISPELLAKRITI